MILLVLNLIGCQQESRSIQSSPSLSPPSPLVKTTPLSKPAPQALAEASQNRQQGLKYRDEGNYEQAIVFFQKAVSLDPQNLSGQVLLGWTLHLARKEENAAKVLEQTLAQDLSYVPALNALGIVYLVSSQLELAIKTHTRAVSLQTDDEVGYYNLSLAYQRLQKYELAIVNAERATTLEPDNPHPWVALAIAYWSKSDPTKAKQAYQRAVSLDSRYSDSSSVDDLQQAGFSQTQIELTKKMYN